LVAILLAHDLAQHGFDLRRIPDQAVNNAIFLALQVDIVFLALQIDIVRNSAWPDSQSNSPAGRSSPSGRNSTYRPVQIFGAGSNSCRALSHPL
jgi:hypothetical protein